MIIGIDPGETVGIAEMGWEGLDSNCQEDRKAHLRWAKEFSATDAIEYLASELAYWFEPGDPYFGKSEGSPVEVVVVEDFRLFQGKQMAQTGSRFEAVQVIGAARLYARCLGVPFITQSPQILRLTEMHMHWPRHAENSHIPDHLSAQLHLLHYAETQGIPTTRLRELNPDILHP